MLQGQSSGRRDEWQIQQEVAEARLCGLKGAGEPLPDWAGEAHTDMAKAAAISIMVEAGALPKVFKIKKLLDSAQQFCRQVDFGG